MMIQKNVAMNDPIHRTATIPRLPVNFALAYLGISTGFHAVICIHLESLNIYILLINTLKFFFSTNPRFAVSTLEAT